MKMSTRTRYGLRAMVNIARNGDRPVSSEAIAACESISKKYLDSILAKLRRAGLVESYRGQGGGYGLARLPGEISVSEVVEVLEGGTACTKCVEAPGVCPKSDDCPTRDLWNLVSDSTLKLLSGITIEKLASRDPGEALTGS